MNISEIWERAKKDADREAPPPKFNAWEGGFGAGVAALVVLWIFIAILNLDMDYPAATRAISITITLVGVAVFFTLRHQEKKNSAAFSRRFRELTELATTEKH